MKLCYLVVGVVLLAGVPNSTPAQGFTAYFERMPGGETLTCGGWLKEMEKPSSETAQAWFIVGYITAMNKVKSRETPSDHEGLIAFVKRYCEEHSLDDHADAIFALDAELDRRTKT